MPSQNFSCSLCHGSRFKLAHRISSQELSELYRSKYSLEVESYFTEAYIETKECVNCHLLTHTHARAGDGAFYQRLSQGNLYYETDKPEFSFVKAIIPEGATWEVLDVGCGDGHFLHSLPPHLKKFGFEFSPNAKEDLAAKGLTFAPPEKVFDLITAFQVIEHVAEVGDFVDRWLKQLKPGGLLFVSTPNYDSPVLRKIVDPLDYPPHHLTQWKRHTFEELSRLKGLDFVSYFSEPIRAGHLDYYLAERWRIPALFRETAASWFRRCTTILGHAHGALLKKR